MLHEHAQFEDGSVSVEAGLMDMLDAHGIWPLQSIQPPRRLGKNSNCIIEKTEGRQRGRRSPPATRYALMMLRFARTETARRNFHREIKYPKSGALPYDRNSQCVCCDCDARGASSPLAPLKRVLQRQRRSRSLVTKGGIQRTTERQADPAETRAR